MALIRKNTSPQLKYVLRNIEEAELTYKHMQEQSAFTKRDAVLTGSGWQTAARSQLLVK